MAGIGYTICGRYFNTVFGQMNFNVVGGSTGLVVMGGDSHSKGGGFESRRRILDGLDIFHIDLL